MYHSKSSIKSYVKDKLKMLEEFSIRTTDELRDNLIELGSETAIDRRCTSIITNHLDRLNDIESNMVTSRKGGRKR